MNEYETGLGTSRFMWQLVSETLDGEKLPESINKALKMLCDGEAYLVEKMIKDWKYPEIGDLIKVSPEFDEPNTYWVGIVTHRTIGEISCQMVSSIKEGIQEHIGNSISATSKTVPVMGALPHDDEYERIRVLRKAEDWAWSGDHKNEL
jgi:hypothetical protein